MAILTPISKSGFIMYVGGLEFFWTQFSGINDTSATGEYANGTGRRIYKVIGPRTIDDVTLTMPYDPEEATKIEQFWLEYDCAFLTITIQPVNCDGETSLGDPYILEGVQLINLTVAEADRESGDVGTIELGFTVNSWKRGSIADTGAAGV
jgi:hypothetical protein